MDATWDLGASLLQLCRPVTGRGVRPASCIGADAERGCQVSPGLKVRPRLGRAQWQRDGNPPERRLYAPPRPPWTGLCTCSHREARVTHPPRLPAGTLPRGRMLSLVHTLPRAS